MSTVAEAVRYMRNNPKYAELIHDTYLGENVFESAERFRRSAEFLEVQKLIGNRVRGGKVLDLGAGVGIASRAFAECGARVVYALEPDPSDETGRGAIRRLVQAASITIVDAYGEKIPLPDEEVDVVYARQVLHHAQNLPQVLLECARVLKPGGIFLACREHVVDNDKQLRVFLDNHPVHQLVGGENAFRLEEYIDAIRSAGLELENVLGPWDTVINAFPAVKTTEELKGYPRTVLKRRLGRFGALLSNTPGIDTLVWRWLKRPVPGRPYTFLATKP
jgi:ubiquinone/menaquinone biosynthesis C-methylase UbiE